MRQLRIALDTGRGDAQGWYELGVLLLQKNDLPAARDAFIHCTNLPTGNVNPEAHNLLGITLAKMGDIRGAVEHFTRAVQLDPGNPNYRENLSRATEQRTPPATR
ncbi:MAG: tetratricopeptide repeat protein [Phycisphaera sp.]|nr:tetratricopeptide repeat protein [Phycisphaera sp.]